MDGRKQKGRWVDQRGRAEEEEEFPLSVLRIHLSVTRTLVHSSACTNTHTIGFGVRTSDRRGNSSHATLCVCVHIGIRTHTHCSTSIFGSSGSLVPLWTCLPLKAWQSFEEALKGNLCIYDVNVFFSSPFFFSPPPFFLFWQPLKFVICTSNLTARKDFFGPLFSFSQQSIFISTWKELAEYFCLIFFNVIITVPVAQRVGVILF